MQQDRISAVVEDRFLVATFLAIAQHLYGAPGLAAARAVLADVRRRGSCALQDRCREADAGGPGAKIAPDATCAQDIPRGAFVAACIALEVISKDDLDEDALPCPIRCASKQVDCEAACDNLPDFSSRLVCNLACGLSFLACLADC